MPTASGSSNFDLHLSKDEQRKRFLARIDEPEKNWKFSVADIDERGFWTDDMKAYGKCLSATSTSHAPRYVVPADDKESARIVVSQRSRSPIQRRARSTARSCSQSARASANDLAGRPRPLRGPQVVLSPGGSIPANKWTIFCIAIVRQGQNPSQHLPTLFSGGARARLRSIEPKETTTAGRQKTHLSRNNPDPAQLLALPNGPETAKGVASRIADQDQNAGLFESLPSGIRILT